MASLLGVVGCMTTEPLGYMDPTVLQRGAAYANAKVYTCGRDIASAVLSYCLSLGRGRHAEAMSTMTRANWTGGPVHTQHEVTYRACYSRIEVDHMQQGTKVTHSRRVTKHKLDRVKYRSSLGPQDSSWDPGSREAKRVARSRSKRVVDAKTRHDGGSDGKRGNRSMEARRLIDCLGICRRYEHFFPHGELRKEMSPEYGG